MGPSYHTPAPGTGAFTSEGGWREAFPRPQQQPVTDTITYRVPLSQMLVLIFSAWQLTGQSISRILDIKEGREKYAVLLSQKNNGQGLKSHWTGLSMNRKPKVGPGETNRTP